MIKSAYNKGCFLIIIIFYLLFVLFYDFAQSRDFINYADWYAFSVSSGIDNIFLYKDPMFVVFSKFSHFFGFGMIGLLVFYVLISAWAKIKLLSVLNASMLVLTLFFVFYFCRFLFLLEGTQFRAAVAIPLASLGVIYYLEGSKNKASLLWVSALLFHLSSFIICIFFFLSLILSRKTRVLSFFLYVALFLFAIFFSFDISIVVTLPLVGERLSDYLNGNYIVTSLSLFNSYLIFKVVMIFVFFSKASVVKDKKMFIFGSLSYFGMLLFVFFRDVDSIALRLHELFSLFDALVFSYSIYSFKNKSKLLYIIAALPVLIVFLNSSLAILN
ncbi:EpsG family protein [Shewanella glacialipiscicola]|uniref:EpsG family protein n=2 Tax=Shewanella glacialipiscicola TaxID=614069 RepID=UPI00200D73DA|nr:EpsG family protein [Shewanella glacialipiscicola]MCL1085197.1 EpsG family protein [Shewanella glacialipiscicola]